MARDYGSRRSPKQGGSMSNQLLVILVTFLLGYLTASFFDVDKVGQWMNAQVLAHQEAKPQATKAATQAPQLPPKPKFEFYTLLANEKGAAQANAAANRSAATTGVPSAQSSPSVASTNPTNQLEAKPNSVISQAVSAVKVAEGKPILPINGTAQVRKGSYSVQVASFKARKDAEHMKGLLTLKGYDVNVVPVSQAQGNWFRVVVGPYANRQLAQQAQVTLAKTERLNGMVKSAGG